MKVELEKKIRNWWKGEIECTKRGNHPGITGIKDFVHFYFTDELQLHFDDFDRAWKEEEMEELLKNMQDHVYWFIVIGKEYIDEIIKISEEAKK